MSNIKTMILIKTTSNDDDMKLQTLLTQKHPIAFKSVENINSLLPLLSNPDFNFDYLAIDLPSLRAHDIDTIDMLNTLSTLLVCHPIRNLNGELMRRAVKICVLIGATTPLEHIKEVVGLPTVHYIGLCSGDGYSLLEVEHSLLAILSGDTTLPQQIQSLLTKQRKNSANHDEINLTPRQQQILNLIIARGASNKTIARMLNISESTVKLHAGALLRKYKVRNRTQLALFARNNIIQ